jgi:uncharacterized membrane protein
MIGTTMRTPPGNLALVDVSTCFVVGLQFVSISTITELFESSLSVTKGDGRHKATLTAVLPGAVSRAMTRLIFSSFTILLPVTDSGVVDALSRRTEEMPCFVSTVMMTCFIDRAVMFIRLILTINDVITPPTKRDALRISTHESETTGLGFCAVEFILSSHAIMMPITDPLVGDAHVRSITMKMVRRADSVRGLEASSEIAVFLICIVSTVIISIAVPNGTDAPSISTVKPLFGALRGIRYGLR